MTATVMVAEINDADRANAMDVETTMIVTAEIAAVKNVANTTRSVMMIGHLTKGKVAKKSS